jgi:hypothetical protein
VNTYAASGTSAGAIAAVILFVIFGVAMWLLPIYIAWRRHVRNVAAITVIDLLLGWTFVGWVACLAWAVSSDTRE